MACCGAAVGAGFAGFETAGYIVNSEYTGPGPDPLDIAVMRGICSLWSCFLVGNHGRGILACDEETTAEQHSLHSSTLFLANCRYPDRASHVLEQSFVV